MKEWVLKPPFRGGVMRAFEKAKVVCAWRAVSTANVSIVTKIKIIQALRDGRLRGSSANCVDTSEEVWFTLTKLNLPSWTMDTTKMITLLASYMNMLLVSMKLRWFPLFENLF
jgi:hypothetical protein